MPAELCTNTPSRLPTCDGRLQPNHMRKNFSKLTAAVAVCTALLLMPNSHATARQLSASATLRGVVTDQQGGLIVGAEVTATHAGTGTTRETQTDGEGLYTLPNLPPGAYNVRVTAKGFAEGTKGVMLPVGQTASADISLGVAQMVEEVCLHCGEDLTPLVDTMSSKVDRVIGEREIESLPLNGRNFLELALLAPGNAPAPNFDPTKTNTVVISSAGPARARRQRHRGRRRQQRRRGRRRGAEHLAGRGAGVSDRDQPLRRTPRPLRLVASSTSSPSPGRTSSTARPRPSSATAACRACPRPLTARRARSRPSTASSTRSRSAARSRKTRAWFFGAFEYRNQDGAVLVGERDLARRTITRGVRRRAAQRPADDRASRLAR